MQLNAEKCKELRISFNVNPVEMDPIVVNGKNLEVVQCIKLLGLAINIFPLLKLIGLKTLKIYFCHVQKVQVNNRRN